MNSKIRYGGPMSFKKILFLVLTLFSVNGQRKPERTTKLSIANEQTTLNDFSRLNKTIIHHIATPKSYDELQDLLSYANTHNLKISIAGSKHSQGGHAFCSNAIVVDIKHLSNILRFDPDTKLITVQAGITWQQVQEYLNLYNCAVKIMQFANLFTVGGSLSVNCNGIDPHYGPLIESVRSIKIMTADGSLVIASRTENTELFRLAIGGLGLFGIIVEATLEVVENDFYKQETHYLSLTEYVDHLRKMPSDSTIGFHYAFLKLTLCSKRMFSNVAAFNFKKIDTAQLTARQKKRYRKLHREKLINLHKIQTLLWTKSKFIKAIHWIPESSKNGRIISRNNIMRPPASHLYVEMPGSTNLLQEYFVPVDGLIHFINSLESITKELNINLLHVAMRYIPKNTESFLSYASTDRVGIVIFFNQPLNAEGNHATKIWTQHLINIAVSVGGTYYLPIQLHADNEQIQAAYPTIHQFFVFKRQYDPTELFMNCFYQKYNYPTYSRS